MEIREKIMIAAQDIFGRMGFKQTTMDEVARAAGVSKKTLYEQFSSKRELIFDLVEYYMGMVLKQCEEIVATTSNPIETILKIDHMITKSHQNVNPMALMELQRFFPESFNLFRTNLMKNDVVLMKENIEKGIKEGYYRKSINPEIIAKMRIENAMMVVCNNLMVTDRIDHLSLKKELMEHFMYGIMTPKGVEYYQKHKSQYYK